MSPRAARRIRGGILAARADTTGNWNRPAVWGAIGMRAYDREISKLVTQGERSKLVEMRLLAQGRGPGK